MPDTKTPPTLSPLDLATILAALRIMEQIQDGRIPRIPEEHFEEVGGTVPDNDYIDDLCERLNCGGLPLEQESEEPSQSDAVLCCPDCERPNQFGELCAPCAREREEEQPYA